MSWVFMLLDFKQKLFVPRGLFIPPMGQNAPMPTSLTKQFALNIYSKIRVQAVLA